jgi:hypothetical protein
MDGALVCTYEAELLRWGPGSQSAAINAPSQHSAQLANYRLHEKILDLGTILLYSET